MRLQPRPMGLAIRSSLSLIALLIAAGLASAQEDQLEFNFLGAGARANGMGDAFIAVADDATAIFWNPAGLFLLDQPEASFGFQFSSEKVDQERQAQTLLLASDQPDGNASLNFASFVLPKRFGERKLVFAFAVQKSFDFNEEFEAIDALDPFSLQQGRNRGGPFSYSGAVSFSPFQGMMLGASVDLYKGSAELTSNELVTLAPGIAASLSGTNRLPVNGTSVGFGALFDFQSRGGPPLRLGAKFVPGFNFSGTADIDLAFRVADSQGLVSEQSTDSDFDYVLDFPLDVGIGLAWNPRRHLLVAADFEHRRFRDSALRVFGTPDVTIDERGELAIQRSDTVDPLSDSGADLNQWRVGFEWSWVNQLTVIPVRVGVKNLPQVRANQEQRVGPDGTVATTFKDQVVGAAFTSGVGIVTDSFVFDLSLEYGGWSQQILRFDRNGSDLQEVKLRNLTVKMSLVIYF